MLARIFFALLWLSLITACGTDDADQEPVAPCLDVQTDPKNCGTCGNVCAAGDTCEVGVCTDICGGTLGACGGACVSLASDTNNCGECGVACAAGGFCVNGSCEAACTSTVCAGAAGPVCADTVSDGAHCGACGNFCAANKPCLAGTCTLVCDAGLSACNNEICADLTADVANCGACGNACNEGFFCDSGACACPAGFTDCGGVCQDLQTDTASCGACGNACSEGFICGEGTCQCAAGQLDCEGTCIEPLTDNSNCGACGVMCEGGSICGEGACVCPEGQELCDGICVDTQTDPLNCGLCGTACDTLDACTEGACIGEDGCDGAALADLDVREMAVFQGVKVPIVSRQDDVLQSIDRVDRNADLVQQRDAVFRVYVDAPEAYEPKEVSARVVLEDPNDPDALPRLFFEKKLLSSSSSEPELDTTFQVQVPADAILEGTTYRVSVSLCAPDAAVLPAPGARFPEGGETAELDAVEVGPLKMHLIPIAAEDPAPELTDEMVDTYRNRLMAIYPATGVELTLGEPMQGARDMCGHLGVLRTKRNEDDAPPDVYYYGLTVGASGNTAGCSARSDNPNNSDSRVSAGLSRNRAGFERGASTMAHEIGHAAGRQHADCGNPAGPDRDFPYPEAAIGVWGYDHRDDRYLPPDTKDMMSYCPRNDRPAAWASDYTYQALLERSVAVNRLTQIRVPSTEPRVAWRILTIIGADSTWTPSPLWVRGIPSGIPHPAVVYDKQGTAITTTTVYRIEIDDARHRSSYMLTVPEPAPNWGAVEPAGSQLVTF